MRINHHIAGMPAGYLFSEIAGRVRAFDAAHPISGVITLTAPNLVDLLTGYYYVNVHTTANPGGEIRGQIGGARRARARAGA